MTKLACSAGVLALTVIASAQTPKRPDFAGAWILVPEKSTPATAPHQPDITITQNDSTLSLTRRAAVFSSIPGQPVSAANATREDITYALAYTFDGIEHPSPTPPMPQLPPGMEAGGVVSLPPPTNYRAIWTQTQLLILTYGVRPDRSGLPVRRLSRMAFSLDADGLLTIESIAIADPTPGGPDQPTPTPVRSVYKKKT